MFARKHRFTPLILLLTLSAALAHAQTLRVSPSTISLSPFNASQQVTVTTDPTSTGEVSLSLSPNLNLYVDVPATATLGTPFTVQLRAGAPPIDCTTQCFLTIRAGQTNATNVPIFISSTGTGTGGITLSTTSVTFNIPLGSLTVPTQTVTLSSAQTVSVAVDILSPELLGIISVPNLVSSNGLLTISVPSPSLVTTTRTGRIRLTPQAGTGLSAQEITVSVIPGGTGTGTNLQATPNPISFNYAQGSTQPIAQSVQLSAPVTVPVTTSFTGPLSQFAGAFSIPQTVQSNSIFNITLNAPQFITSALQGTLTFTPAAGFGLFPTSITITTNPGGTGATGINLNPASLVFSNTSTGPVQQFVQVTSTVGQLPLTTSLSSNLAPYFSVPATVNTNSQFGITLNFPQSIPFGTSGTLTLTPPAGFGLFPVSLPISIGTGTGTGTGSVIANPSTLSFTTRVNTPVAEQQVTLTGGIVGQPISTGPSAGTNFLQLFQSSFTSPVTLRVRVDPTFLTAPGDYTGGIDVFTGGALAARIPVTVTVTPAVTVTPTPAQVTLTAAAGSATAATSTVQLAAADNTIAFTAAAATTSGGSSWLTVTPTSGNLGSSITISANAQGLQAGTYNGSVIITSQGGTVATIPVTFTVSQSGALTLSTSTLTFAHQTTSSSAPPAQTVQITSTGAQLTWTATPTSTGGWLQVSPATGNTGQALTVSINPAGLTAGAYEGTISVASSGATNSPQTITVRLTVTTPILPTITSVVNGASFAPTVAVPGLIMTIRGTDLGPAAPGVSGNINAQNQLSTEVSGVRVLFDSIPAPILFASATQLNVIVPYEIANRVSTRLTVTAQNQTSRELELRVGDTAPGLFTATATGSGQGAILNQNGSINSASNPEQRGNIIVLYGTGHGQTNPPGTTGLVLGATPRLPFAPVSVRIGGQPAEVLYAGSAPGLISGALQINVRIPQNAGTGQLPVDLQIGSAISQAGVTVAVQ